MNGILIKKYREFKKIKRSWLASQLGVDDSTLMRIEKNESSLTVERLYKISQLLEISILELFEEKHLMDPNLDNFEKYGEIQSSFIRFIIKQNDLLAMQNAELQEAHKKLIESCSIQNTNLERLMRLVEQEGISKKKVKK